MMDLKAYMKRAHVSKKKYVDEWIDLGLIPGADRDAEKQTYSFPDSSVRPYRSRWLKPGADADKIRAHIVKAAIARQYICAKMCFMSKGEFEAMVSEMVDAGLLRLRTEDDIVYIDSTLKSAEYKDKNLKEIRKFILDVLSTVTEAAAEGVTKGLVNNAFSSATPVA